MNIKNQNKKSVIIYLIGLFFYKISVNKFINKLNNRQRVLLK